MKKKSKKKGSKFLFILVAILSFLAGYIMNIRNGTVYFIVGTITGFVIGCFFVLIVSRLLGGKDDVV